MNWIDSLKSRLQKKSNMAYSRNLVRNPRLQARIFLPNWFVKIVRPGKDLPENQVQMHVSMDMNRIDIKNYLEKIYNIKVHRVNTRIQLGKRATIMKCDGSLVKKKYADYKVAYVTLAEGTFHYPDLFEQKDVEELQEMEETPEGETPPEREITHDIKNWLQF